MIRAFQAACLATILLLAACASPPRQKMLVYDGPEVTQIVVNKSDRRMYLMNGTRILKRYDIHLGNSPVGHKQFEGDGKTPEGVYMIDRFNPNSLYHLSVGISYPNTRDAAFAQSMGRKPGGDIFIHGRGREGERLRAKQDWTAGCIAVEDEEIREIYTMLRPGVPIVINP